MTDTDAKQNAKHLAIGPQTLEIVEQIRPLLAGREPVVQSAVLAELLSLLLAGHWIPGEPNQTEIFRRELLSVHSKLVWELIKVNAAIMGTDQ
jgi:hypothetical protein